MTSIKGEDEAFASNKYLLHIASDKVEEIYNQINKIEEGNVKYKVTSNNINKIKMFEGIYNSLETVLIMFLSITMLISVTLLILVLFSYVLDYKKDIGIMMGIGILKQDISLIFIIHCLQ